MDRLYDWIDERDSGEGSYLTAFMRIVTNRAFSVGPAVSEEADMPRWLARTMLTTAIVLDFAILAGVGLATRAAAHAVHYSIEAYNIDGQATIMLNLGSHTAWIATISQHMAHGLAITILGGII